jgi:uncharacterized SAM-binding protein YcdF (DUF218 family)
MTHAATRASRLLTVAHAAIHVVAYTIVALVVWIVLGLPVGLDAWLDVSEPPVRSEAIVCLAGGITSYNVPLESGWDRVYTASQLFADGFAPYVIFSGRGSGTLSEAEIYRDAGVFLGVPQAATLAEPGAQSTADHPGRLLAITLPDGRGLSRDSTLLIVTSDYHARRVLMTFRKAGFHGVRVVVNYRSAAPTARHKRPSSEAGYTPSGKSYNDPMLRLAHGSMRLLILARETVAIAWYWSRGLL